MKKKQDIMLSKSFKQTIFNCNLFVVSIIIFLVGLCSCSSNNTFNKECSNCYKLKLLDSATFQNYIFLVINDNAENNYYLLSSKVGDDQIDTMRNLRKLKVGDEINMNLNKIPSTIVDNSTYSNNTLSGYHYKDIIIWYLDTFRVDLYNSNQIVDKYCKY